VRNSLQIDNIEISGIDVQKGFIRFAEDEDAYLFVLNTFIRTIPPRLEKAFELCNNKSDLPEYETIIHGIKGSCSALFADEIADKAAALEKAAKAGDYEFVLVNNDPFLISILTLLSDMDKALEGVNAKNRKPLKNKPETELLYNLMHACEKYDMDSIDSAMEELESFSYETGVGLVYWLRENVEQANFNEIIDRLSYEL